MPETMTELSLVDTARRLGLSWNQTWRLVLTNKIDGRKAGRLWLVSLPSIERYELEHPKAHAA